MKAAYISVLAALAGFAAAAPEKRRPGVQCVADGDEVSGRAPCDSIIGDLEADPEKEVRINGGSYSLGCANECKIMIYPKNGNEITIKQSALVGDIQQILNTCANDGPFVGTFTEESGPLGRRTEITKTPAGIC